MRCITFLTLIATLLGGGIGILTARTNHPVLIVDYPLPTEVQAPGAITPGPDGNLWFTYRTGVARITPHGDITTFPTGEYLSYLDITAGPDGNVWSIRFLPRFATDWSIVRITPEGNMTRYLIPGNWETYNITAGPDGNVSFTGLGNRIGRITPDGTITQFDVPEEGSAGPITAGPDGNLWLLFAGSRVGKVTPDGAFTLFDVPMEDSASTGITAGSDGDLWFTEGWRGGGDIRRITPTGVFTEFDVPDELGGSYAITSGADDALWFTTAHGLGRMTVAGQVSAFDIGGDGVSDIATGPDGNIWFTRWFTGEGEPSNYIGKVVLEPELLFLPHVGR